MKHVTRVTRHAITKWPLSCLLSSDMSDVDPARTLIAITVTGSCAVVWGVVF